MRDRWPAPREDGALDVGPRTALWQKLFEAAVRARSLSRRAAADREMPRIGRRVGGCLMRLVILVVILFLALAAAAFFLFGRVLL